MFEIIEKEELASDSETVIKVIGVGGAGGNGQLGGLGFRLGCLFCGGFFVAGTLPEIFRGRAPAGVIFRRIDLMPPARAV